MFKVIYFFGFYLAVLSCGPGKSKEAPEAPGLENKPGKVSKDLNNRIKVLEGIINNAYGKGGKKSNDKKGAIDIDQINKSFSEIDKIIEELEKQKQGKSRKLDTVKSKLKVLRDKVKSGIKQTEAGNDAGGEGGAENYTKEIKELEGKELKLEGEIKKIEGLVKKAEVKKIYFKEKIKNKKNDLDKNVEDISDREKEQKNQINQINQLSEGRSKLREAKKEEKKKVVRMLTKEIKIKLLAEKLRHSGRVNSKFRDKEAVYEFEIIFDDLRLNETLLDKTLLSKIKNLENIPMYMEDNKGLSTLNEIFIKEVYELLKRSIDNDKENELKLFMNELVENFSTHRTECIELFARCVASNDKKCMKKVIGLSSVKNLIESEKERFIMRGVYVLHSLEGDKLEEVSGVLLEELRKLSKISTLSCENIIKLYSGAFLGGSRNNKELIEFAIKNIDKELLPRILRDAIISAEGRLKGLKKSVSDSEKLIGIGKEIKEWHKTAESLKFEGQSKLPRKDVSESKEKIEALKQKWKKDLLESVSEQESIINLLKGALKKTGSRESQSKISESTKQVSTEDKAGYLFDWLHFLMYEEEEENLGKEDNFNSLKNDAELLLIKKWMEEDWSLVTTIHKNKYTKEITDTQKVKDICQLLLRFLIKYSDSNLETDKDKKEFSLFNKFLNKLNDKLDNLYVSLFVYLLNSNFGVHWLNVKLFNDILRSYGDKLEEENIKIISEEIIDPKVELMFKRKMEGGIVDVFNEIKQIFDKFKKERESEKQEEKELSTLTQSITTETDEEKEREKEIKIFLEKEVGELVSQKEYVSEMSKEKKINFIERYCEAIVFLMYEKDVSAISKEKENIQLLFKSGKLSAIKKWLESIMNMNIEINLISPGDILFHILLKFLYVKYLDYKDKEKYKEDFDLFNLLLNKIHYVDLFSYLIRGGRYVLEIFLNNAKFFDYILDCYGDKLTKKEIGSLDETMEEQIKLVFSTTQYQITRGSDRTIFLHHIKNSLKDFRIDQAIKEYKK